MKVVGDFQKAGVGAGTTAYVRLVVPANDLVLDWRRYNLIANYLAEYSAYRFEPKDAAENLISSIFYELIEYMAKCSRREAKLDIRFYAGENLLNFDVSSNFSQKELAQLEALLSELLASDLEKLYQELLSEDLDSAGGRRELGLAMVAHDYHAGMSAGIDEESGAVTLRARVSREEFAS